MIACENIHSPLLRLILEPWIIPALFLAYIPQYVRTRRHGTAGISPYWILYLCLFSTTQLTQSLLGLDSLEINICIRNGELRGAQAFGAVLSSLQVAAQWSTAFIFLYFYLKYAHAGEEVLYVALPTDPADAIPVHEEDESAQEIVASSAEIPSSLMIAFITIPGLLCFPYAIYHLQHPEIGDFWKLSHSLEVFFASALFALVNWLSLILLCVWQVYDTLTQPNAKGISIISLTLQVIVLSILAVLQAVANFNDFGRLDALGFFWFPASRYVFMALVHAVCLGLRIRHSRHGRIRLGSETE